MKKSYIQDPDNNLYLIVMQWALVFIRGNACAANFLSAFIYGHDRKKSQRLTNRQKNDITELRGKKHAYNESLLPYYTYEQLKKLTLSLFSITSIKRAIKLLFELNVITLVSNLDSQFKPNYVNGYLFHSVVVNQWLTEYKLLKAISFDHSKQSTKRKKVP